MAGWPLAGSARRLRLSTSATRLRVSAVNDAAISARSSAASASRKLRTEPSGLERGPL